MGARQFLHSRPQYLDVPLTNDHHGHHHAKTSSIILAAKSRPLISPLQLPPREESTRVQLQHQLLREQQSTAVVPINGHLLPGLKTSAAFFDSLRTNLYLHAAPPLPSPMSTPPSMRGSTVSLPPPSPLSVPIDSPMEPLDVHVHANPFDNVPELKTYIAHDECEKIDALRLVADSVAQMRQTANHSLIFHPLNLTVQMGCLAWAIRRMYTADYDPAIIGITIAGLISATLITYRFLTQDYLSTAEDINWDWLGDSDILVTCFGDDIIGALVVEWQSGESRTKKKKAWQGQIRAWTVRLKYRAKGVGSSLLEEAVRESRRKGAETLEFADNHANSKRILPAIYNRAFDLREQKSRDLLLNLYPNSPIRGKKR